MPAALLQHDAEVVVDEGAVAAVRGARRGTPLRPRRADRAESAATPSEKRAGERRRQIRAAWRAEAAGGERAKAERGPSTRWREQEPGRNGRASEQRPRQSSGMRLELECARASCIVRGSVTDPFHLPKSGLARSLVKASPPHSPGLVNMCQFHTLNDLEPELQVGVAAILRVLDERQILVVIAEARTDLLDPVALARSRS